MMQPLSQVTHHEPRPVPRGSDLPQPGDLILVQHSEWYALRDGELLRICEHVGWTSPGRDLFVARRHQVRTFWGPDHGAPDGIQRVHMSTSGGPFKSLTLAMIEPLVQCETRPDTFWRWIDWPRAGGGVEYQCEVVVWKLSLLPNQGVYKHAEEKQA